MPFSTLGLDASIVRATRELGFTHTASGPSSTPEVRQTRSGSRLGGSRRATRRVGRSAAAAKAVGRPREPLPKGDTMRKGCPGGYVRSDGVEGGPGIPSRDRCSSHFARLPRLWTRKRHVVEPSRSSSGTGGARSLLRRRRHPPDVAHGIGGAPPATRRSHPRGRRGRRRLVRRELPSRRRSRCRLRGRRVTLGRLSWVSKSRRSTFSSSSTSRL
jgi:hypothetical protein